MGLDIAAPSGLRWIPRLGPWAALKDDDQDVDGRSETYDGEKNPADDAGEAVGKDAQIKDEDGEFGPGDGYAVDAGLNVEIESSALWNQFRIQF